MNYKQTVQRIGDSSKVRYESDSITAFTTDDNEGIIIQENYNNKDRVFISFKDFFKLSNKIGDSKKKIKDSSDEDLDMTLPFDLIEEAGVGAVTPTGFEGGYVYKLRGKGTEGILAWVPEQWGSEMPVMTKGNVLKDYDVSTLAEFEDIVKGLEETGDIEDFEEVEE